MSDREALTENVRAIMRTRQGKEVIWHILSLCGLYDHLPYNDVLAHQYIGKRAIGLEIIELLSDTDPTIYPRLLLEYADKEGFEDAEGYGAEAAEGS